MNVARLNINVGGKPTLGFTGNASEFVELGRLVGGELPASYLELMRHADGGHPEIGSCPPLNDELFDLDRFYALANPNVENVRDVHARWSSVLGHGMLPLGEDGGGNQVYIALLDSPPAVWLYRHESGERLKLASSLEAFIEALVSNPDFI
jgi:hypothetical protein